MSGLKDFLAMTRHERRGTIVVLVVIAVILAMTAMVRSCPSDSLDAEQVIEMQRFQNEVDTVSMTVDGQGKSRKPKAGKKKPRRPRAKKPKHVKPAPQPRRIDPVPQF